VNEREGKLASKGVNCEKSSGRSGRQQKHRHFVCSLLRPLKSSHLTHLTLQKPYYQTQAHRHKYLLFSSTHPPRLQSTPIIAVHLRHERTGVHLTLSTARPIKQSTFMPPESWPHSEMLLCHSCHHFSWFSSLSFSLIASFVALPINLGTIKAPLSPLERPP
jgi:hypothetical protein